MPRASLAARGLIEMPVRDESAESLDDEAVADDGGSSDEGGTDEEETTAGTDEA
jgi:hypothetical protein